MTTVIYEAAASSHAHAAGNHVTTTLNIAPAAINRVHDGVSYSILLKPDDSNVYLDIEELGLHHHQVKTTCEKNDWDNLELEADHAAFTIIDLYNVSPKVFL